MVWHACMHEYGVCVCVCMVYMYGGYVSVCVCCGECGDVFVVCCDYNR